MTQIKLAEEVFEDLDRIFDHLVLFEVSDPAERIEDIVQALDVLERNPQIGRPADGDLRELVIGRRSRGYMALYLYVAELDTAYVLALRSQSEAGYAR